MLSLQGYFIFIYCLIFISLRCEAGTIVMHAAKTETRIFDDAKAFQKWFQRPDIAYKILSVNPGLLKVDIISSKLYRGHLSPVTFFGVQFFQTIDFDIFTNATALIVTTASEDALQQICKGSPFLVNIFNKIPPAKITSKTTLITSRNEKGEGVLTDYAELNVMIKLPSWSPIPAKLFESTGSKSISSKLSKDLSSFLDNIKKLYEKDRAAELASTPGLALQRNVKLLQEKQDQMKKDMDQFTSGVSDRFKSFFSLGSTKTETKSVAAKDVSKVSKESCKTGNSSNKKK